MFSGTNKYKANGNEQRTARLNCNTEGETLGAAVFLSAEQLESLGAALDTDTETVEYHVDRDGSLILETERVRGDDE